MREYNTSKHGLTYYAYAAVQLTVVVYETITGIDALQSVLLEVSFVDCLETYFLDGFNTG